MGAYLGVCPVPTPVPGERRRTLRQELLATVLLFGVVGSALFGLITYFTDHDDVRGAVIAGLSWGAVMSVWQGVLCVRRRRSP